MYQSFHQTWTELIIIRVEWSILFVLYLLLYVIVVLHIEWKPDFNVRIVRHVKSRAVMRHKYHMTRDFYSYFQMWLVESCVCSVSLHSTGVSHSVCYCFLTLFLYCCVLSITRSLFLISTGKWQSGQNMTRFLVKVKSSMVTSADGVRWWN